MKAGEEIELLLLASYEIRLTYGINFKASAMNGKKLIFLVIFVV